MIIVSTKIVNICIYGSNNNNNLQNTKSAYHSDFWRIV